MDDNSVKIVISIIGLIGTLTGAFLGYFGRSKKQAIEDARREQSQQDLIYDIQKEMQEIKKKLDTHNHYAERIGRIEKSIISIEKDVSFLGKAMNEKK